ncbi:MAG: ethanolamine utilization microcompartment protein EutL [Clostridiaceae bacterium]
MKGEAIPVRILAVQIIPQAAEALKQSLGLLENERSLGILTTDCDDASYVALDEATKAAAVRVVYARSLYAGSENASTALAGEFIGILAAESPCEVQSGLQAAQRCLAEGCSFISANASGSIRYFAHCVSRTGSYLSQVAGVPEGTPLAYVIAPPAEAIVGIDAALKSAEVQLARFYGPPTETNFAGALVAGQQAACVAACEAFAEAVIGVAESPLRI